MFVILGLMFGLALLGVWFSDFVDLSGLSGFRGWCMLCLSDIPGLRGFGILGI